MVKQNGRRAFALSLVALMLMILCACQSGDNPGPAATSGESPSPTGQTVETPPARGSESPDPAPSQPAGSVSPSPSQSESPQQSPNQSPQQSPSQSPQQSPSQSPVPSQSGTPAPVQSPTPSGTMAEGEDVGNGWFADAVFVGDSRTDGLRLYSGIRGASFICHTGLSVFTVGSNACIKADEGKITAMDALAKQQWAKVYLMLGVNELGYSTATFQEAYTKVVEQIKELQPGASIYLQTLIPINEPIAYENGTSRAINNEKLKAFNQVILDIAQAQGVCLVDVDVPFWSEDGCLAAENTGDGVHLTRTGYQAWYAYLRTHTGNGGTAAAPADPPAQTPEEGDESVECVVYTPPVQT